MARKKYRVKKMIKIKENIFFSQIVVCIFVTLIIFMINSIKADSMQKISYHIKNTLYYNVDFKKTASDLKDILNDLKKEVIKNDNSKEEPDSKSTEAPDNI